MHIGTIIYYICGFGLGVLLGIWVKRRRSFSLNPKQVKRLEELRGKSQDALVERTNERKEKILEFMAKELEHQKELEDCKPGSIEEGITRIDIEKLLEVSETTARKYLNLLESEEKIKQIGQNGPDVRYTLIP